MSRVTTIGATGATGATGAHELATAVDRLHLRGITVLLAGPAPGHQRLLAQVEAPVFTDTASALTYARQRPAMR